MNVLIREAQADDAAELIAYIQRLADERTFGILLSPGEFNPTIEQEQQIIAEFAAADNSIFLVAVVDGQIIGVLTCRGGARQAIRHTTTLGMSVHREWRDRGIGHALLTHAVEWARGTGVVKRIELQVFINNARARHLYEKVGFQIEGQRRQAVFRDGEYFDDLIMALLL